MTKQDASGSLKIAAIYAAIGCLWILFSDRAVGSFTSDPATFTCISMVKGWVYVLLTALLLYWLIRRYVNEVRLAESTLSLCNEKFSVAFNHSPVLMTISSIDTGTCFDVNEKFCQVSGFSREEAVGRTSVGLGWISAPAREALIASLSQTGRISEMEVELTAKDGRTIHCLYSGEIVTIEGEKRLLSTALDNTERKTTLTRLHDSEVKFRSIFDAASDAIFILAMDGSFIDVNRAAYTRLGYTREELLAIRIDHLDTPEFAARVAERLQKVREEGVFVFESAHRCKDGTVMPVEVNCRLHEFEGRQVYFSVIRDITERKQAELLLRESEERYRRFSSLTSDYVYSCRRSGDSPYLVQWLGGAVEEITGYSQEEVQSMGCWLKIVHPDDFQRISSSMLLLTPGERLSEEFRIIRKDGAIRWIRESCSCEQGESPGELILFGTSADITARKTAEAATREVESLFNMVLEHSPVYLFFKDENLRVTRLSRNYENMLGLPIEQLIGKSMTELFPGDFAARMMADDRQVLDNGLPFVAEEDFAGSTFKTFKFPILQEGQPPTLAGFTVDVTDLKKAQREVQVLNQNLEQLVEERTADLQKSNADLAGFSYAVSHELRAPIVRIQGFSAILGELCKGADETAFMASRIENACRELQSVVDSILMLSRLSTAELSLQSVDLSAMVAKKLALLLAENPERTMELNIMPGLTAVVDPGLMDVCLNNLINNAFKYTGQTPAARIEFGRLDISGEAVYFVRDNGAGFNMAYAEKLYAPFQRLHQHKEFPGNGIGLATVKRIIDRHGGDVWAESSVGSGATFYFTLGGAG